MGSEIWPTNGGVIFTPPHGLSCDGKWHVPARVKLLNYWDSIYRINGLLHFVHSSPPRKKSGKKHEKKWYLDKIIFWILKNFCFSKTFFCLPRIWLQTHSSFSINSHSVYSFTYEYDWVLHHSCIISLHL